MKCANKHIFVDYVYNDVKNTEFCYKELKKGKLKVFLKKHKTAIITILTVVLTFIVYLILNRLGEDWRGYKAIGGEVLVFLAPFLIVCLRDCINDIIDIFKSHK